MREAALGQLDLEPVLALRFGVVHGRLRRFAEVRRTGSLADKGGLYRNLTPDAAGIRTVLELRSKYGAPQKALTDPSKYVDVSYYEKATGKR